LRSLGMDSRAAVMGRKAMHLLIALLIHPPLRLP
jgi:hypothetical protein